MSEQGRFVSIEGVIMLVLPAIRFELQQLADTGAADVNIVEQVIQVIDAIQDKATSKQKGEQTEAISVQIPKDIEYATQVKPILDTINAIGDPAIKARHSTPPVAELPSGDKAEAQQSILIIVNYALPEAYRVSGARTPASPSEEATPTNDEIPSQPVVRDPVQLDLKNPLQ